MFEYMKRHRYFVFLSILILLLLSFILLNKMRPFTSHKENDIQESNNINDSNHLAHSNEENENITSEESGEQAMPNEKEKLDILIEKMSLEEKIGQMIFGGIDGTSYSDEAKSLISDYHVGGIILFKNNLETTEKAVELLNQLKRSNQEKDIPLFLGVDQEGGRVERLPDEVISLPTNKIIGERNDEQFSYEIGSVLGKQLNAYGFNLNFAPVLDVNSNPQNPVIGDRSFSNDPEVVGKLGVKTMQGMQAEHIVTAVKHFPGHGDTSVDSHFELPTVEKSLAEIEEMELIPFKQAIKAGVDIVMTSHILLPKIDPDHPASMSKEIITGILRERLDYDGVVVSDDMTMHAITNHFDIGEAAIEAISAGTDLVIVAHGHETVIHVIESLKQAVADGKLKEQRIDESVRRLITLKWERGITNDIVESIDIDALNETINKALEF